MNTAERGIRVSRPNKISGRSTVKLDGSRIGAIDKILDAAGKVVWVPLFWTPDDVLLQAQGQRTRADAISMVYNGHRQSELRAARAKAAAL